MTNGVECKHCGKTVVPRLWHDNMDSIMYRRQNQHICPICGVTMYVTGGGYTVLGIIVFHVLAAFIIWFGATVGIQELLDLSNSASANFGLLVLIAVAILYIAKRFFGFTIRSLFKNKKQWQ